MSDEKATPTCQLTWNYLTKKIQRDLLVDSQDDIMRDIT